MEEIFTSDTYGEINKQIEGFMENHDIYEMENVVVTIKKVPATTEIDPDGYQWEGTVTVGEPSAVEKLKSILDKEYEDGSIVCDDLADDINEIIELLNGE